MISLRITTFCLSDPKDIFHFSGWANSYHFSSVFLGMKENCFFGVAASGVTLHVLYIASSVMPGLVSDGKHFNFSSEKKDAGDKI
jgi:hypothetical protein